VAVGVKRRAAEDLKVAGETIDVVGIGNAIMDVLARAEDAFLEERGLVKGTMSLIDEERADAIYAEMGMTVQRSGGSAANTTVGIASLGGSAAFVGRVRNDALGESYARDIQDAGVGYSTTLATSGPGTGRCLIVVTPDGERTMQTYLGACADLGPDDVDPATITGAAVTYLEGYLWDPPPAKEAFLKAASIAHGAGRKVSLSLSDRFCVDRHRDEFLDLVDRHVDILFANESEIVALFEARDFDDAVERLGDRCEVAALTRGESGALVVHGGVRTEVAVEPVSHVMDTTGAGDLFAAGFLFGITHGHDPATAGRIGAIASAEIISHVGARPATSLAELVRQQGL
jgi:sugar/nucleoside kinase (ribokinase family)